MPAASSGFKKVFRSLVRYFVVLFRSPQSYRTLEGSYRHLRATATRIHRELRSSAKPPSYRTVPGEIVRDAARDCHDGERRRSLVRNREVDGSAVGVEVE